jgi:hypothetical protein
MNVMIDLETMSTSKHAAVASLGAVLFDPRDVETVDKFSNERLFYVKLDLRKQVGRDFDGDTVYFWLQQDDKARLSLCENVVDPREGLAAFTGWYIKNNGGVVWSHGATFDHVIIEDLYRYLGLTYPVKYKDQFCARTVVRVSGVDRPTLPSIVNHRAIDDAVIQTIWLQQALAELRGLSRENPNERTILPIVGSGDPGQPDPSMA